MARWEMVVLVVMVTVAMAATGAADTAAAESPPNCDSAAAALLPCYPFVTGNDAQPPAECCGGLSGLNTNSPACMCQLITQLNNTAAGASDPSVNLTKAFNLPKDCAIILKTTDCPALANLPLAPPAGLTPTPTTTSPGPTAALGPGTAVPGNDVSRLMPTSSVIAVAAAVTIAVQAITLF